MAQVAARYASVFNDVEQRWQEALAGYEAKKRADTNLPPQLKGLDDPAQEEVRQFICATTHRCW